MDSDSINISDRMTDRTVTVIVASGHDAVQETQTNYGVYNCTSAYCLLCLYICMYM